MHQEIEPIKTDIAVLREMVRLAENRRAEEWKMVEKINQYNLALIGFSGSFLSLLVTVEFSEITVQIAGICLLFSLFLSLLSVRPRTIHGGTVSIASDVSAIRNGNQPDLHAYLFETADILENANRKMSATRQQKSFTTLLSAVLLALALFSTYTIRVYA